MKRWTGHTAGLAAVAAVAAAAFALGGCGATPTPTASPVASVTGDSGLGPSTPPLGYVPALSWPTSVIPWSDVGPGWFLVSWSQRDEHLWWTARPSGLSLLSPEGEWYVAATLNFPPRYVIDSWFGEGVGVYTYTGENEAEFLGDRSIVSLATGASSVVLHDVPYAVWWRVISSDTVLDEWHNGEGVDISIVHDDGAMLRLCRADGPIPIVSPDLETLVCFGSISTGAGGSKTAILVASLADGAPAVAIDSFRLTPSEYSFNGWLDDRTFLLSRAADEGTGKAYFSYEIDTTSASEFDLPFAGGDQVWFDGASQTFTDVSGARRFFTRDGAPIDVDVCAADETAGDASWSGGRALLTCGRPRDGEWQWTEIWLVDPAAGSSVKVATAPEAGDQGELTVLPAAG